MRWLALVALAGCTDVADIGTPWQDAALVTGAEVGPEPTLRAAVGCTLRVASWNLHFLRDPAGMGAVLGPRALRFAIKDEAAQSRMLKEFAAAAQL